MHALGICTSQEKVVVDDMSDLTLARPGFHLSVRGQLRRTALVTYFGVTSFLKDEGNGRFGNRIYVRPKEFGRSSVNWLLRWLRAPWTSRQRAQRLLMQFLTPEQCEDYRRSGLFIVESQLGHRYLVGDGSSIRKLELDDRDGWRPTTAYCLVPASDEQFPQPDVILATTLLLSFNEQHFLSTATVRKPQKRSFSLDPVVRMLWL